MAKQDLIDTIGKVFVDNDFREQFNNNTENTIAGISGLSEEEKKFLGEISVKIGECTSGLSVRYEGENKRK